MKEIKGFDGNYAVNADGEVYSFKRAEPILMRTRLDRYGYELITLYDKGHAVTKKVHRLVLETFLPVEGMENLTVNHKNGIKTDNHINNLEWATVEENHHHAFRTGLHSVGENRTAGRKVKLTDADIPKIRQMIDEGYGNTEIGKHFKVSCGCIYAIRMRKSWTHI